MFAAILITAAGLAAALTINTVFRRSKGSFSPYIPQQAAPEAVERLAAAVRIKTVSHVDYSDNSMENLRAFQDFLLSEFPAFNRAAERTLTGDYGVIYKWQGSDESLPPVLLTAHYDVVPADPGKWSVPPFSGLVKDGFIWGRGTLDTKNTLVAIMEAAEELCKEGFVPSRTVWLAFGGDEEASGREGAVKTVEWFVEQGISFDWMLDEGSITGDGLIPGTTRTLSMIGTAEKGTVDISLEASAAGGHASRPPEITAIGRISRAVARIERKPFPLRWLGTTRSFFREMSAASGPATGFLLANLFLTGGLIKLVMGRSPGSAALLRTTTAATIISGGWKENVLPDYASAVINVRILPGDDIDSVVRRLKKVIADKQVSVSVLDNGPNNPVAESQADSEGYGIIRDSIASVLPDSVILPFLVLNSTDSKFFTGCCRNIYRYVPMVLSEEELDRIHGIDERISVENYGLCLRFYRQLMEKL